MIDYKAIADADIGDGLEDAFIALKALSAPSTDSEHLMSYLSIANQVDFATSMALETVVKAAIVGSLLPEWVDTRLNNTGVDVNNVQTAGLLTSLVAGPFTQAMVDAIVAAGVTQVFTFPSVQLGHLQNAREKRIAGVV